MIVSGCLYKYIYVGYISIATLKAVYKWYEVYVAIYIRWLSVFGSHNS
jgi:hypothetical protein